MIIIDSPKSNLTSLPMRNYDIIGNDEDRITSKNKI